MITADTVGEPSWGLLQCACGRAASLEYVGPARFTIARAPTSRALILQVALPVVGVDIGATVLGPRFNEPGGHAAPLAGTGRLQQRVLVRVSVL